MYSEPVLYYYPTDREKTESRESLTSSPGLDQLDHSEVRETEHDNSEEERREEEEDPGSAGHSVSMTPLLNLNSLMK